MEKSTFIKIKLTATTPKFKDMIGLEKSDNTSFLVDFVGLVHPNGCKVTKDGSCEVFGKKNLIYTLYTTCIIKTDVDSGKKTMYKY